MLNPTANSNWLLAATMSRLRLVPSPSASEAGLFVVPDWPAEEPPAMCKLRTILSRLGLRMVIQAVQNHSPLLLLLVLLVVPTLHASTIFPIATNPVPEATLSAAFDGTNYLVAIQGGPIDHDEVTYQLFSKTG